MGKLNFVSSFGTRNGRGVDCAQTNVLLSLCLFSLLKLFWAFTFWIIENFANQFVGLNQERFDPEAISWFHSYALKHLNKFSYKCAQSSNLQLVLFLQLVARVNRKETSIKKLFFLWRFMPRSGELLNFFQHITPQSLFRQRAKEEAGESFLFTPTNLGKIFKNSIQRNEKLMRKTFPASRNTRFIFQFYLATSFPNVFIWGFCSGTRRSRRQKKTLEAFAEVSSSSHRV